MGRVVSTQSTFFFFFFFFFCEGIFYSIVARDHRNLSYGHIANFPKAPTFGPWSFDVDLWERWSKSFPQAPRSNTPVQRPAPPRPPHTLALSARPRQRPEVLRSCGTWC